MIFLIGIATIKDPLYSQPPPFFNSHCRLKTLISSKLKTKCRALKRRHGHLKVLALNKDL